MREENLQEKIFNYLEEKYKKHFEILKGLNVEKPYPQFTVLSVLEPMIRELVEAQIRPYELLKKRIEQLLKRNGVLFEPLSYNNFYMFLKRKKIINSRKNKSSKTKRNFANVAGRKKDSSLLIDPIEELKN
jgi:hypothetical protein